MQQRPVCLEYRVNVTYEEVVILEEEQTSDIQCQRYGKYNLSNRFVCFFTQHHTAEQIIQSNRRYDNKQIPPVEITVKEQRRDNQKHLCHAVFLKMIQREVPNQYNRQKR